MKSNRKMYYKVTNILKSRERKIERIEIENRKGERNEKNTKNEI